MVGGFQGGAIRMRAWLVLLVAVACGAQGRTRLSGPVPEFSVGSKRTGSIADFGSIQEAVDAAPEGGAVIRLREGTYREPVRVDKRGIRLIGEGRVLLVTDSGRICAGACPATLTILGDDFFGQGFTVADDGKGPAAAGAVEISGDRAVLRDVRLTGMAGVVRLGTKGCEGRARCRVARQFFSRCVVEGTSELVTGAGRAVFSGCELRSAGGGGAVTGTVGQTVEGTGFVFEHCVLTGVGQLSLGRPPGADPAIVLLHTEVRVGVVTPASHGATALAAFDVSGEGVKYLAARELTEEEARAFAPAVFLAGDDRWDAEKVR